MAEMSRSAQIQGGLYMLLMIIAVIVTLVFGLISPAQMGLRLDTLPMGIVAGLICQLPIMALSYIASTKVSKITVDRGRIHFKVSPIDAPVAELFWSGVITSPIIALLLSLGLFPLLAAILGAAIGAGIHLFSHLGPMRMLVPEGDSKRLAWFGFFLTMFMNRVAFGLTNNIVAAIIGHAMGSFGSLVVWRLKGQIDSIL